MFSSYSLKNSLQEKKHLTDKSRFFFSQAACEISSDQICATALCTEKRLQCFRVKSCTDLGKCAWTAN